MKACARRTFDRPIEIPAVQATVLKKANEVGMAKFQRAPSNGKTVGIIGAGPAGLGAASVLAQRGYKVTIYEQQKRPGGAMNLIPDFRLNKEVVRADIAFLKSLGDVEFKHGNAIASPEELLAKHDAVVVCAGLSEPIKLNIPGEELALSWQAFLENQKTLKLKGKKVAVLGGGAVAVDCATTAKRLGAASVELIYRRRQQDMPLTQYERDMLLEHGVEIASLLQATGRRSSRQARHRPSHRAHDVACRQGAATGELHHQQKGIAGLSRVRSRDFRHRQPSQTAGHESQGYFLRRRHGAGHVHGGGVRRQRQERRG